MKILAGASSAAGLALVAWALIAALAAAEFLVAFSESSVETELVLVIAVVVVLPVAFEPAPAAALPAIVAAGSSYY